MIATASTASTARIATKGTVDSQACGATGWVRGPDLPDGYGPDRTYLLDLADAR